MPFYLYEVASENSNRQFQQIRPFALGGKQGPLAEVQRRSNPNNLSLNSWHATGDQLVAAIGSARPAMNIIVDLMPSADKNVSLYRLLDVWGFSEEQWTPIAIHLEALFVEKLEDNPLEFKRAFTVSARCESVGEFLYLLGGTQGGDWRWGRVGSVNGALLWGPSFNYLAGNLGKAMSNWGNGGAMPSQPPVEES